MTTSRILELLRYIIDNPGLLKKSMRQRFNLETHQLDTALEQLEAAGLIVHTRVGKESAYAFVQRASTLKTPDRCPACGKPKLRKDGLLRGIQRYECGACGFKTTGRLA